MNGCHMTTGAMFIKNTRAYCFFDVAAPLQAIEPRQKKNLKQQIRAFINCTLFVCGPFLITIARCEPHADNHIQPWIMVGNAQCS